jgi:hypothetical protein
MEYHQGRKKAIGIQFMFHIQLNAINATVIKGGYDIDGQPMEYQQRRRESMGFQCIFNWM